MSKRYLIIITITLIYSVNAHCQFIDKFDFRFGLFSIWGVNSLGKNPELNKYLTDRSYPAIKGVPLTVNFCEIESQMKRLILKGYKYRTDNISKSIKSTDYTSELNVYGNAFLLGYEIYSNKEFSFYPLVGYEEGRSMLKLTSPNGSKTFENFLDSSNSLQLEKAFSGLRGEFCVRGKYNEYINYIFCVGYHFKLSEKAWKYYDNVLQNGPPLNLNGFYFNFGIQLNSILKNLILIKPVYK